MNGYADHLRIHQFLYMAEVKSKSNNNNMRNTTVHAADGKVKYEYTAKNTKKVSVNAE